MDGNLMTADETFIEHQCTTPEDLCLPLSVWSVPLQVKFQVKCLNIQ